MAVERGTRDGEGLLSEARSRPESDTIMSAGDDSGLLGDKKDEERSPAGSGLGVGSSLLYKVGIHGMTDPHSSPLCSVS
jgi:hypothetical protein